MRYIYVQLGRFDALLPGALGPWERVGVAREMAQVVHELEGIRFTLTEEGEPVFEHKVDGEWVDGVMPVRRLRELQGLGMDELDLLEESSPVVRGSGDLTIGYGAVLGETAQHELLGMGLL